MTRGRCRHCSVSVNDAAGWWQAEYGGGDPGECPAAPPVPDPACGGSGTVFDPNTDEPVQCWPCAGSGEVPGPHWPWRHPSPI